MTPTEQDKELREQLQGISYKAVVSAYNTSQAGLIDYAHELTEELIQLITADRKRVALEARITALEYAKISPKFKIEERIEALKQELENYE